MATFSSSVVNKSGKRFAPKVAVRRGGPGGGPGGPAAGAPAAASARRPSIDRRASQVRPPSAQPEAPPRTGPSPRPSPHPEVREPLPATTTPTVRVITAEQPRLIPSPKPVQRKPEPRALPIPIPSPRPSRTPPVVTQPAQPRPASTEPSTQPTTDTVASAVRQRTATPAAEPIPAPDAAAKTRAAKRPRAAESGASTQTTPAKRRKKSTSTVPADDAGESPAETKPRPQRRKREKTPEDAETLEIQPTVIKMSDLCRDIRIGKRSNRETELRTMDQNEAARKRRDKEARKKRESTSTSERREKTPERPPPPIAAKPPASRPSAGGPKMRIVNGEIVLDTSSLQIDRHADAARDADEMEQVEENLLTRKINSASFGKRTKVESWDMEMTNLFYRGLRMFGTDFMMISKMFPGRSRRQIKLKFSNEERKNPDRIKQTLLGPRETVTLEDYSDMTNTVYDDPKIIEQELAAEKRKIEEEHEKQIQAAKDQLLRNPAKPNVLPSIEGGGVHTGNRRQFGHGRAVRAVGGGGTEQVLGSIDDF